VEGRGPNQWVNSGANVAHGTDGDEWGEMAFGAGDLL